MAIAYDKSAQGENGNVTTLSWAHNVAAGSNLCLVVFSTVGDNNRGNMSADYNSVSMTEQFEVGPNQFAGHAGFTLLGPATGNNNVTISITATAGDLGGLSNSYSGVGSIGDVQTAATNTVDVTTASGDVVNDHVFGEIGGGAGTPGTGQTKLQEDVAVDGGSIGHATSEEAATGSSVTMSWTDSYDEIGAIVLQPAASGRIMSSIVRHGGLVGPGGLAGPGGGLAGL